MALGTFKETPELLPITLPEGFCPDPCSVQGCSQNQLTSESFS